MSTSSNNKSRRRGRPTNDPSGRPQVRIHAWVDPVVADWLRSLGPLGRSVREIVTQAEKQARKK